jgi:hypothetical protein
VLTGLGIAVWVVVWLLPLAAVRESLQVEKVATIMAGPRDAAFFVEGWSPPATEGNVTSRTSAGTHAAVRIPLAEARDYDLLLRADPAPRPADQTPVGLPAVRVFMNGAPLGVVALTWNPERVGAYTLRIPGSHVRVGFNRLALVVEPSSSACTAIRLWYLRLSAPGS